MKEFDISVMGTLMRDYSVKRVEAERVVVQADSYLEDLFNEGYTVQEAAQAIAEEDKFWNE